MIKKGALLVGIAVFIVGLGLSFVAFNQMFNPSPNATITVNGVAEHPGSSGYQTGAEIFLGITVIIALIGLFISFTATFKPQWIKTYRMGSQPWGSPFNRQSQFSQNKFNQPTSQNFQQQQEQEQQQQQPVDYSDINILGTSPSNNQYSNSNSINDSPQPSNDYSESFDSNSQPSNDYSDSFNSTTQSAVSNKSCPFCGSMIKENEQFCNSCGKRL